MELTYLGEATFRNSHQRFGVKQADRTQHTYMVGKSGSGKSTLLLNLILQDIHAGRGVGLIDPHGDLADAVLAHVPKWRTRDVIVFDPSDLEYPLGFNLLHKVPRDARPLVTAGIVGAMKAIWRDSWGPRLEYILANAVAALLDAPNTTLLAIPRLLTDERFRAQIVSKVEDPVVKYFWEVEFASFQARYRQEAVAPVQNKIGQFLMNAPIRQIVGQVTSRLSLAQVMDTQEIFIAKLSKGAIGEEPANLLGSLLVTEFGLAALRRSQVPESARVPFHLFVDEVHNYTTKSFATILSEARKYRLGLHLSTQFSHQLEDEIRRAVFGNVGTIVAFRVGAEDADELSREFAPVVTPEDLVNLERYEVYLRLMIDGQSSRAFSARTLPPMFRKEHREAHILRESRERFARPRHVVERKIEKWLSR